MVWSEDLNESVWFSHKAAVSLQMRKISWKKLEIKMIKINKIKYDKLNPSIHEHVQNFKNSK